MVLPTKVLSGHRKSLNLVDSPQPLLKKVKCFELFCFNVILDNTGLVPITISNGDTWRAYFFVPRVSQLRQSTWCCESRHIVVWNAVYITACSEFGTYLCVLPGGKVLLLPLCLLFRTQEVIEEVHLIAFLISSEPARAQNRAWGFITSLLTPFGLVFENKVSVFGPGCSWIHSPPALACQVPL